MTTTETTIFTRPDWPDWFASMQSPEWDRSHALVFADWCQDRGDEAVGEYVRAAVELDAIPPVPETTNGPATVQRLKEFQDLQAWRERYGRADGRCRIRLAKLESDNPAWSRLPCPECGGGKIAYISNYGTHGTLDRCNVCHDRTLTRWPYTPFIRAVGLQMEEIVRRFVPVPGDGDESWTPTPLALALRDGLPTLRRLRVMDREPLLFSDTPPTGATWGSSDIDPDNPWPDRARIPRPIFDLLRGFRLDRGATSHLKTYTPDAAHDALAGGVYQWVAGFTKPDGAA